MSGNKRSHLRDQQHSALNPMTISPGPSPSTPQTLPLHADLWTRTLGWCPSDRQQQQFQRLYEHICEANRSLNLTRITEPEEFWEKHLWDSLSGVQSFLEAQTQPPGEASGAQVQSSGGGEESAPSPIAPPVGITESDAIESQEDERVSDGSDGQAYTDIVEDKSSSQAPRSPRFKVLDIGTGAGFPGLPVAIAFPYWHVTLLDSTRKKMAFIQGILPDLQLDTVRTVTDRAEALGHDTRHRYRYDLVLIRAVASASVCAEYVLPFLKVQGQAVLYRGRWAEYEMVELKQALNILGGSIETIHALSTPLSGGDRHCIIIRKDKKTPKGFPRGVGVPTKTPLVGG